MSGSSLLLRRDDEDDEEEGPKSLEKRGRLRCGRGEEEGFTSRWDAGREDFLGDLLEGVLEGGLVGDEGSE